MAVSATSERPENSPLLNLGNNVISPTSTYDHRFKSFPPQDAFRELTAAESWVPKALHRRTLFAFATAYTAIIIALTALFTYSNKHNGLASSNQSLYYLWTFGPTAVFTIVASLWTKVEYHTKQLAPWRALANGPSTAKQTLLRDYVSAWTARGLTSSVEAGDYDVTLSIAGALLLQLLVVFSTGLLALEQRNISEDNFALTTTTKFSNITREVTARPFSNALANQLYGLDQPYGATDTFAYQTLNTNSIPPNVTVTATVDALYPNLNCQAVPANWTLGPDTTSGMWETGDYYQFEINITDPKCPHSTGYHGYTLDEISRYSVLDDTDGCLLKQGANWTTLPGRKWWIWVSHIDIDDRNRTYTSLEYNGTYRDGKVSLSTIACEPTIEMRKARVTTDGLTYSATLTDDPPTALNLNISAWDMQDSVEISDSLASMIFNGASKGPLHMPDDITLTRSLFILMNASMPRDSLQDWMDIDFLMEASRMAYQRVAVHVALEQYITAANGSTHGVTTWVESRLVVRPLSFYLTTSILAVLIFMTTFMCRYRPSGLVPHDPGSIVGLASIIASSPELQNVLENTGSSGAATKMRLLGSHQFQSGITGHAKNKSFQIRSSGPFVGHAVSQSRQTWWQPFPFTFSGKIVTLLSPIAGIIVLEILHQRSNYQHGIADVSPNPYVHYTWVYLPALMVWGINIAFKNLYSNNTFVQPYYVLRHGAGEANHVLTSSFMSNFLIHNVWVAVKRGYFTILLSSIAVLLGGILPVAVPGLYTSKLVTHMSLIQPMQENWFNATQGFYAELKVIPRPHPIEPPQNHEPIANWILYNNFSFPRWTYGPYALSAIDFSNTVASSMNMSDSTISANIPAIRGRTNCTIIREKDIHLPGFQSMQANWSGISEFGPPMAEKCFQPETVPSTQDLHYYGRFSRSDYSLYNISEVKTEAQNKSLPLGSIEFWEPSPRYVANASKICAKEVTLAFCWPYVEQVVLNTTFQFPSFDIKSAEPLPRDPNIPGGYAFFSAAELVSKMGEPFIKGPPDPWGNLLSDPGVPDSNVTFFDPFMDAVIWGRNGIPAAQLVGRDNEQRLLERVDDVYGLILAQLYNSQARIPAVKSSPKPGLAVVTSDQYRVVQSIVATRILEAVLACMLLCCIAVYLLLNTKELLPQNPCSIGAAASYVAGSRLCDGDMLVGGMSLSVHPGRHGYKVLEGSEFGFGWYIKDEQHRYGVFERGEESDEGALGQKQGSWRKGLERFRHP